MKRIFCTLLVSSLVVGAIPFGTVFAETTQEEREGNPRLPDELTNCPRKSIKGGFVEYGPGGYSPGHTHPKSAFINATVLEGDPW
jgi:quercetin dioxygenase-like cupin family protein